jgi:HK97 family phage prohead protease
MFAMSLPDNMDQETWDEDWLRTTTWDVRNPVNGELITTLNDLCAGNITVTRVQEWTELPAWQAAPDALKQEAIAYLQDNLPNGGKRAMEIDQHEELNVSDIEAEPTETRSTVPAVPKRHWSLREYEPPIVAELQVRGGTEGDTMKECGLIGWPSTTGDGYDVTDWLGEYRETINSGAFGKTLKESDYIPALFDHRGDVLAAWHPGDNRTMDLAEDRKGLRSEMVLDVVDNAASRTVASGVRRGDLSKMSFAFRATKEDWNEDYTERMVGELQLFDVSIVKSPANKMTSVGLRSDICDMLGREGTATLWSARMAFESYVELRTLDPAAEPMLEQAMRALRYVDERMLGNEQYRFAGRARTFVVVDLIEQVRQGKSLSSAKEAMLQSALDALAQADNALATVDSAIDEGQRAISQALGVENPDPDDDNPNKVANNAGLDAGSLNDGHPVLPNDGAGVRSVPPSVIKARHEIELLKLRSRKS